MSPSALLDLVVAKLGPAEVRRLVRDRVRREAHKQGWKDTDDFLTHYGVRPDYRTGLAPNAPIDTHKLARVLRALRIRLEDWLVEPFPFPWERWKAGAVLAVVLGQRPFATPAESKLSRLGSSGRDVDALARLVSLLNERGIRYRLDLHSVLPDTTRADATRLVEELRRKNGVGAVVCIGSPRSNPITDAMAERMLDDVPGGSPARFHFPQPPLQPSPFLCEVTGVTGRSDISVAGAPQPFHRVPNDEVLRRARVGDPGPFSDCGLLIIDARQDVPLIIAAGHGGCGTSAAVMALGEDCPLDAARTRNASRPLGPRRTLSVVTVARLKGPREGIDDTYFDDDGWGLNVL